MKFFKLIQARSLLFTLTLTSSFVFATEINILQRIKDLENRVIKLEKSISLQNTNWKDPIIWGRLKKEMSTSDVKKLLGKPYKIEKAIFTTWYFHTKAKRHSFVWFDEDKLLGWEAPE